MPEDKTTVVDAQAQLEGKLSGKDATVHGRVRGEVNLTGRLLIGEEGKVHASVAAESVEIAGQLEGDVRARAVILKEPARGTGRTAAPSPGARDGAWLSGPVASGEPPRDSAAAKPATPAPAPNPPANAGPRPPGTPGA